MGHPDARRRRCDRRDAGALGVPPRRGEPARPPGTGLRLMVGRNGRRHLFAVRRAPVGEATRCAVRAIPAPHGARRAASAARAPVAFHRDLRAAPGAVFLPDHRLSPTLSRPAARAPGAAWSASRSGSPRAPTARPSGRGSPAAWRVGTARGQGPPAVSATPRGSSAVRGGGGLVLGRQARQRPDPAVRPTVRLDRVDLARLAVGHEHPRPAEALTVVQANPALLLGGRLGVVVVVHQRARRPLEARPAVLVPGHQEPPDFRAARVQHLLSPYRVTQYYTVRDAMSRGNFWVGLIRLGVANDDEEAAA